ncbi:hypothetical protein ACFQLX_14095 [Streptomyces polyrhachis]|uniref:Helix-turn-helix DNA binding domain protein n=1 Tax=Streptomyces polyrhachis TaxID=1282885 RepID=A0ABW2GJF9_9ACTN
MTQEEVESTLKKAAAAKKRAEKAAGDAQRAFEVTVADALREGLKPARVAELTGYSYETIRRIARQYEVERLREPTVTSRRKAAPADD